MSTKQKEQAAAPVAAPTTAAEDPRDLWTAYQTDKALETDGVWIEDFPGGVAVKIRRPSSNPSVAAQQRAQQKHRAVIQRVGRKREELPVEIQREINIAWFANGIIVDWKGVVDKAGKALPFTPANAIWLFNELPDFLVDIINVANNPKTFATEDEDLEDDEKN